MLYFPFPMHFRIDGRTQDAILSNLFIWRSTLPAALLPCSLRSPANNIRKQSNKCVVKLFLYFLILKNLREKTSWRSMPREPHALDEQTETMEWYEKRMYVVVVCEFRNLLMRLRRLLHHSQDVFVFCCVKYCAQSFIAADESQRHWFESNTQTHIDCT